jgi:hypothetical protein
LSGVLFWTSCVAFPGDHKGRRQGNREDQQQNDERQTVGAKFVFHRCPTFPHSLRAEHLSEFTTCVFRGTCKGRSGQCVLQLARLRGLFKHTRTAERAYRTFLREFAMKESTCDAEQLQAETISRNGLK